MGEESPYVHLDVVGHFFGHRRNCDPLHNLCTQHDCNRHTDCNSHPQVFQAVVVSWAQYLLLCDNHPKRQNKQNHIAFNSWKSNRLTSKCGTTIILKLEQHKGTTNIKNHASLIAE